MFDTKGISPAMVKFVQKMAENCAQAGIEYDPEKALEIIREGV